MRPWLLLASLLACSPEPEPSRGPDPAPVVTDDPDALLEAALSWLDQTLDPDRYGDARDYQVLRVFSDDLGLGHVHLRQTVDGVPVFGAEIIVHLFADGTPRAVTFDLLDEVDVETTPLYTADEAIELAGPPAPAVDDPLDADAVLDQAPTAALSILRHDEQDHLVWVVQLSDLDPEHPRRPRVFVDARTGEEVWRYDDLQTVDAQVQTRYDGTHTLGAHPIGATWYLEDPGQFLSISFRNSTSRLYYVTAPANGTFTDQPAGSVHYGTTNVTDYYAMVHGRDAIDDLGGPGFLNSLLTGQPILTGAAHFGFRYNNAFWDGTNLLFISGDGDGSLFNPLVSLDVIGHEFTHGVTQFSANLIYANESGALNESVSDVFGAAVEAFVDGGVSPSVWEIGEDCFTPGTAGDALRYMDDPTADGSSSDHYDDRYVGPLDNGGVHWNSGIANLAFYLVSEGGNHPTYPGTPVTGLGIDVAEQIWYRALTTYATASTDFQGFRLATLLAAEDLYGSGGPEWDTVEGAWTLVGLSPWALRPSGWAENGVGAPAVVYRKPTGEMVMAFESRTGAPTADCPNGEWSIGLATSTDGRNFDYAGAGPILGPAAGTYRSCVVAHPTMVLDDAGTGFHLWFKAEQDLTTCGGRLNCLYSGVGYAHVSADLSTVDTISAAPVIPTTRAMGYPSVVRSDGTWVMALQKFPDLWFATAPAPEGPWTLEAAPYLSPGVTAYAQDEVYNPALVCEGDAFVPPVAYTSWFGGRDRDGTFGPVLNGGVGKATSEDGVAWNVTVGTLYPYTGNEDWRHWSVVRHGTSGALIYYAETVGGLNRIGLRTELTGWSLANVKSRTCPQPSWW